MIRQKIKKVDVKNLNVWFYIFPFKNILVN